MPCSECNTDSPEPFDCYIESDSPEVGYWFMVAGGLHASLVGVSVDGDLVYRFLICHTKNHPEPDPDQEILCIECFDRLYPEFGDGEDEDFGETKESWQN